jgi:hypothetical protein
MALEKFSALVSLDPAAPMDYIYSARCYWFLDDYIDRAKEEDCSSLRLRLENVKCLEAMGNRKQGANSFLELTKELLETPHLDSNGPIPLSTEGRFNEAE